MAVRKLCLETYQKDPKPYLERLAKRTFNQELRKGTGARPPGSPLNG